MRDSGTLVRKVAWAGCAPLLTVASCASCNGPKVIEVDIVPKAVTLGDASVSTTFELEARLWTGDPLNRLGISEKQKYPSLKWSPGADWLEVKEESGFRATFRVKSSPTGPAKVTVKAGGKTAEAPISASLGPVTGQDLHMASYTPDKPPVVSLVSGNRTVAPGEPCVTLAAFVRQALLGQVIKPCGTDVEGWAAAFAVDHQVVMKPVTWTAPPPPDNTPDATGDQGALRSLPIALHVMAWEDGMTQAQLDLLRDTLLQAAKKDKDVANANLAASRAGIRLTLVLGDPEAKHSTNQRTVIGDCVSGDEQTRDKDVAGVLNVYYVDDVDGPRKGQACAWTENREREVIYVGRVGRSGSTLGHEVGHALSLVMPGAGHTNFLRGFDRTNMMGKSDYDGDHVGRTRFTVGQIFRMNADSGSWLAWAREHPMLVTPIRPMAPPPLACQCAPEDVTGPCPLVLDDVAHGSTTPPTLREWKDCHDLLELGGVPEHESPVAILGGRPWRTPPQGCSQKITGTREWQNSATYIKFANLTRPASTCKVWAAVFFRDHGPMHLKLEGLAYSFTQGADQGYSSSPMPARTLVRIHVYYDSQHESEMIADTTHATETLETLNRTGLDLVFGQPSTTNCPTTAAAGEYNLCYTLQGAAEATQQPKGITVSLNERKATTVSHWLGRLIGFDVLDQPAVQALGLPAAAFPDNIMWRDPLARGKVLTLGQIFRLHVKLGAPLPACDTEPLWCPRVEADVEQ